MSRKRRRRSKRIKRIKNRGLFFIWFIVIIYIIYSIYNSFNKVALENQVFLASATYYVDLFDEQLKKATSIPRGTKIIINKEKILKDDENNMYYEINVNSIKYYVKKDNIVNNEKDIVMEQYVYVRTPINLLEEDNNGKLLTLVKKGEQLEVIDFDKINNEGIVNIYTVKVRNITGIIAGEYTALDKKTALLNYKPEKYYDVHEKRGNRYGGGYAGNLDYYPAPKPTFKDNKMPDPVYALYLNSGSNVISHIDQYIDLVKNTKINAFVIDIKDNQSSGYASPVMKQYSITNYNKANNSFDRYKTAITKLKDAGYYVIGRITVFKDKYYAIDHPEHAISSNKDGSLFLHQNTYWPSAYQRDVWEFNVNLAKEAVKEMGFNEIQFDYVRFPDKTKEYEKQGLLNFRNTYNEEKAQAIQRFVRYACNE